jgi:hypothetical protein
MAVGGLLATRLRGLESLIADESTTQIRVPFADQSTTPVSTPRPDPSPPEVTACLNQARVIVDHRVQGLPANVEQDVVQHALNRAHEAALEHGGELDGPTEAQELFGARAFAESAIVPILEALDYARGFHLRAVAQVPVGEEARAVASRRLATAHSSLMFAVARLVVEVGRPITDALREASEITKALRAKVQEVEKQLTSLERKRLQTMPGWSPGKRDA